MQPGRKPIKNLLVEVVPAGCGWRGGEGPKGVDGGGLLRWTERREQWRASQPRGLQGGQETRRHDPQQPAESLVITRCEVDEAWVRAEPGQDRLQELGALKMILEPQLLVGNLRAPVSLLE